jgi:hypothetical protein
MAAVEPLRDPDDDPAATAAAVRALAAEAHAVLTRAAADEPGIHREAIGEVLRRIAELQGRLGEGRLHHLRLWLDGLQRQALVVQGMVEIRRRVEDIEARQDDPGRT